MKAEDPAAVATSVREPSPGSPSEGNLSERSPAPGAAAARILLDVPILGMTCTACANRVEKQLNRLDGVSATVNFATERATIEYDPGVLGTNDLVAQIEAAGYGAVVPNPRDGISDTADTVESHLERATAAALADLRQRLTVSAALTIPVLIMSMVPAMQFRNWQWAALALAWPVTVWGAMPFHRAAVLNLRHASATMDTLVSIGVLAAFGWSLYALFWGDAGVPDMKMAMSFGLTRTHEADEIYLEVAATVTTFILLGRFLEARAKRNAGAALEALMEMGAKEATVLEPGPTGDVERRVPIDSLVVGDRFVVRPGEKVATDGVVVSGSSALDTSLLTGESIPVDVSVGDPVTGATLNTNGLLVVEATRVGADTALAQIGRLVSAAQSGKAEIQRLADRVSAVFVPVVMTIAAATLGFWLGAGWGANMALTSAVAVLIVACPCALGLATPTALLVGTGRGAQMGILIKGPEVLESTRRIDTVVLDKTGTLTTGRMTVSDVVVAGGGDPEEALALIGSLESGSEHPIAAAVASHARERLGTLDEVSSFVNRPGLGVEGEVRGRHVVAGRPSLFADHSWDFPAELETVRSRASADGKTVIAAGWDDSVKAVIVVEDSLKATSEKAIALLRDLGLRPVLLTGDNRSTAEAVGREVGIDEVIAEVLPAEKAGVIRDLQRSGRVVAMVGDGVNDAAALATADLGLAIGTGADAAIEASDLTLVGGDPTLVADAIRLSRRTLATIKGNLFWAFGYNVCALPLAASGFLNPVIAGGAMAFSSVFVVSNSLRLRRFR